MADFVLAVFQNVSDELDGHRPVMVLNNPSEPEAEIFYWPLLILRKVPWDKLRGASHITTSEEHMLGLIDRGVKKMESAGRSVDYDEVARVMRMIQIPVTAERKARKRRKPV